MMPVPSMAGCISTFAAPCRPMTVCCRVPFFSFTLKSLRRASSMAFCTATGTSRALLELGAHVLLGARGADEHLVARGRGDLRVDVRVGAMHGEAHGAHFADLQPGLARAAQPGLVFCAHDYFFFVSFSTTTSFV